MFFRKQEVPRFVRAQDAGECTVLFDTIFDLGINQGLNLIAAVHTSTKQAHIKVYILESLRCAH